MVKSKSYWVRSQTRHSIIIVVQYMVGKHFYISICVDPTYFKNIFRNLEQVNPITVMYPSQLCVGALMNIMIVSNVYVLKNRMV